jgi:hypothetical protein
MTTTKALCIALLAGAAALHSESGYKLTGRYPLPGTGGWDYVSIDGDARRIYVSHATQVEVLDADSGKQVGTIPDCCTHRARLNQLTASPSRQRVSWPFQCSPHPFVLQHVGEVQLAFRSRPRLRLRGWL